ncbi:hypothetical protein BC829DRAFT_181328 [Chytridium lagenaria]|nr:hypothetical protein BC829DRAFT_181328 [Chytridium lagenaria]
MSTVGPSLGTSSEEREELTVEDVLKRLQNGLFGVLFITNKNSDHNLTWHILETLIDHMQDLGFPLCFAFAPWQKEISWFRLLTKWFSPEKMIKATPVVFNILLSALGVVLLNALFVGFSFSQNRFRFIWTLKLLRVTLGLISTILFIPFLAFFTLAIVNCEHHDIQSCWTSPYLLKTIGTVAVMTLFILLALCVKATFFEPDPKIKDVSSRPHSRLDLLYLTCRTTLTLATIALEVFGEDEHDGEKNKSIAIWVTAVLCVVASMALAIGFIWYIPYYNFKYAMFRAGLMAHFAWASLCFFYTVLRPESDIGILYLIEAPLAFVVACLLVSARRRQVEGLDPSLITDPFVLELHIRFKLLNAGLLYKETGSGSPVEKKLGGGSAVSGGAVSGGAVSGISIGGYRPVNGEKEWSSMDEIVEIFVMASKTMPSSCILHLFAGAFHLNHLGNRAQCLATYTKAESMHPRLDEAFMIYRRQRLLNERFSGGDVIDFIAFEQNMQLAKKYESKATMAVINFWAELLKRHPSFWRLQRHGTTISQAASTSQGHYLALIKLSPNTAHVYRLYGNFLINVLNDQKQGQDLLDHADELEEENREEMSIRIWKTAKSQRTTVLILSQRIMLW